MLKPLIHFIHDLVASTSPVEAEAIAKRAEEFVGLFAGLVAAPQRLNADGAEVFLS